MECACYFAGKVSALGLTPPRSDVSSLTARGVAACKFVLFTPVESLAVFFRFGAALALVVAIALAGTALETQNLAYKRQLSQQQYRLEVLVETQASLKLEAQRLGTPAKLFDALQKDGATLHRPAKPQRHDERRTPLLNWNHSAAHKSE